MQFSGECFCTLSKMPIQLMRQMTIPCLSVQEMDIFIKEKCPMVYEHIGKLTFNGVILVDFAHTVIEITGLKSVIEISGILPEQYQCVLCNLIEELVNGGELSSLIESDMGKTWYGSLISTYFSGSKEGRQIKKKCKKRVMEIIV